MVSHQLVCQILVVPMHDEINPQTTRLFMQAMNQAKDEKASLIIIDMNTYGGSLKEADTLSNLILNSKIPIWAYINNNAASAGALISLACDSIYMSPRAKIGAASVVNGDGEIAPEKYQSYMRTLMRSNAQSNNRNPNIAEKMVGVKDSIGKYEVLSYTTTEAIKNKYCEGQYDNIKSLINTYYSKATFKTYEPTVIDVIFSFFLNPFVRSILLLMIIGGIYFEFHSPGIGFPIVIASIGLIGYFIPNYINGFVSNWEIFLFILGSILLAVEILFIPGFGFVGIIGFVFAFGGLLLAAINNDYFDFTFVSNKEIAIAIGSLFLSTTLVIVVFFWLGDRLLDIKSFQKLALVTEFKSNAGYQIENKNLIGAIGTATTSLRPSGKITIQNNVYDAYTSGEFIDSGVDVIVVSQQTSTLKVRKHVS
jgi:membrane-bound serine protease (ClpP class)